MLLDCTCETILFSKQLLIIESVFHSSQLLILSTHIIGIAIPLIFICANVGVIGLVLVPLTIDQTHKALLF
jgi:nitrate reductase gamma subunit